MTQPFQAPRGTRDLFGKEKARFDSVIQLASHIAEVGGFQAISTPTFEHVEVFNRSIGQGTDIIDKELFTLASRTEAPIKYALRPEGTAGIVRAFLEHGVQSFGTLPVKLVSMVNNFRYDKPQSGRYREHTQWDLETICNPEQATTELAYIVLTNWRLFEEIGLSGVTLAINNLGNPQEQSQYTEVLKEYLSKNFSQLGKDSQERLEKNPLRVLDSKDPHDLSVVAHAPKLSAYTEKSKQDFEIFQLLLQSYDIDYRVEETLVRGLDYYQGPVFEWLGTRNGQQSSLGGGGRYDRLLTNLGSKTLYGAVGSGVGIDRVLLEAEAQHIELAPELIKLQVILLGGEMKENAILLKKILRSSPYPLSFSMGKNNLGKEIEKANRGGATHVLIVGENERRTGMYILKSLNSGEQLSVNEESITNGIPELIELQ